MVPSNSMGCSLLIFMTANLEWGPASGHPKTLLRIHLPGIWQLNQNVREDGLNARPTQALIACGRTFFPARESSFQSASAARAGTYRALRTGANRSPDSPIQGRRAGHSPLLRAGRPSWQLYVRRGEAN